MSNKADRDAWIKRLPSLTRTAFELWGLRLGTALLHEKPTSSWVCSVLRDDIPVVLKISFLHMEARDEAHGLRFWNGDPTVDILEANDETGAMLLKHCLPGISLRSEPEQRQDEVITTLLKRLWKRSMGREEITQFRKLSEMLAFWEEEALAQQNLVGDKGLLLDGLAVLRTLGRPTADDVLLATDLHAGNVLSDENDGWKIIDPKPFVGDRGYDLIQHTLNCTSRLQSDPIGLINRLADLAEVDSKRALLWLFGRVSTMTEWQGGTVDWQALAKRIAP